MTVWPEDYYQVWSLSWKLHGHGYIRAVHQVSTLWGTRHGPPAVICGNLVYLNYFCTSCLQLSLRNLIIDRLASFVVTSHMACDSLLLLCGEQSDAFEVQPRQARGALAGAAWWQPSLVMVSLCLCLPSALSAATASSNGGGMLVTVVPRLHSAFLQCS